MATQPGFAWAHGPLSRLILSLYLLLLAHGAWGAGVEISTGTVQGTGTANTIPLWTDTNTLANSLLTQSGGNVVLGSGAFVAPAGTASYAFSGATTTGLGLTGSTPIISTANTRQVAFSGQHVQVRSVGSYGWSTTSLPEGTSGSRLFSDVANSVRLRNGTTAQAFQVARTFTDGSNQAYGEIATSGTELYFRGVEAGTGGLDEVIFGQAAMTSRLRTSLATPGTLSNGDWWAECAGTLGVDRQCFLAIRDNGVTYTVDVGGAH